MVSANTKQPSLMHANPLGGMFSGLSSGLGFSFGQRYGYERAFPAFQQGGAQGMVNMLNQEVRSILHLINDVFQDSGVTVTPDDLSTQPEYVDKIKKVVDEIKKKKKPAKPIGDVPKPVWKPTKPIPKIPPKVHVKSMNFMKKIYPNHAKAKQIALKNIPNWAKPVKITVTTFKGNSKYWNVVVHYKKA